MAINSITLVGRALSDPETTYYESGSVRASFQLLVRYSGDDQGIQIPIEAWGESAQVINEKVQKGSLCGVIGRLKKGEWKGPGPALDAGWRAVYVSVDRFEHLGAPKEPST
jgi:single-stranded DNA-binding protein